MKNQNKEIVSEGKLHEVLTIVTTRPNGTKRIQQDFQFCPSKAEQHTAHLTDINYLLTKYTPDELTGYIIAKAGQKQAITGHDFSHEISMVEAKNRVYELKNVFQGLRPDVKSQFSTPLEFFKFVDNPHNVEKLKQLGLISESEKQKINDNQITNQNPNTDSPPSPTAPVPESGT